MKANTTIGEGNLIQGTLTDEDLELVIGLIENIYVEYFDCGHGIHLDKKKDFVKSMLELWRSNLNASKKASTKYINIKYSKV